MMETETQEYPEFFTYKSTFEDLVEFPKTEQSSDELRKLINEVLQDQEVIVGLSQIPNKKQKNVDYILKPKKKSTSSKFIGIRIQKFEVNYIIFELYTLFRN